tara:strand:- start:821 stop:997 length:177 start_codon:yes stop_codon:yes gene_type:complete
MSDLVKSDWYKILVVFLVMPLNGVIIAKGSILLGSLLILLQLPWFINCVLEVKEESDD